MPCCVEEEFQAVYRAVKHWSEREYGQPSLCAVAAAVEHLEQAIAPAPRARRAALDWREVGD